MLKRKGSGLYLVKELRAEWCWVSGIEGWRGCGRDRTPGAGMTRRASQRKCPVAEAPSSAGLALPNLCLEDRCLGYSQSCGGRQNKKVCISYPRLNDHQVPKITLGGRFRIDRLFYIFSLIFTTVLTSQNIRAKRNVGTI